MPYHNWEEEAQARKNKLEQADRLRTAYVKEYALRQSEKKAIATAHLARIKKLVAEFAKTSKIDTTIRQTIRIFDPGFSFVETIEGFPCPLSGEVWISSDHTPAFVIESHGQKCPTGAPGYKYVLHFGIERRVEITTTICIDDKELPYLHVRLLNIDGRTHLPTWNNTLVKPTNPKLISWLKKEIALSGVKNLDEINSKREERIFLPD